MTRPDQVVRELGRRLKAAPGVTDRARLEAHLVGLAPPPTYLEAGSAWDGHAIGLRRAPVGGWSDPWGSGAYRIRPRLVAFLRGSVSLRGLLNHQLNR